MSSDCWSAVQAERQNKDAPYWQQNLMHVNGSDLRAVSPIRMDAFTWRLSHALVSRRFDCCYGKLFQHLSELWPGYEEVLEGKTESGDEHLHLNFIMKIITSFKLISWSPGHMSHLPHDFSPEIISVIFQRARSDRTLSWTLTCDRRPNLGIQVFL